MTSPRRGLLGLLSPPCPLPLCLYICLHSPPPVHFPIGWRITVVYNHIFTEIWEKQKRKIAKTVAVVTSVPKAAICARLFCPPELGVPLLSFSQPSFKSLLLPPPPSCQGKMEKSVTLSYRCVYICTPPPGAPGPLLICLILSPSKGPPSLAGDPLLPAPWEAATVISIVKQKFSLPRYIGNFLSCLQASL